jgi:hypothetical protein
MYAPSPAPSLPRLYLLLRRSSPLVYRFRVQIPRSTGTPTCPRYLQSNNSSSFL